jgi:hypothetical protein
MIREELIIIDNSHLEIVLKFIKKVEPFFNKITLCVSLVIKEEIVANVEILDKFFFMDIDINARQFDSNFSDDTPLLLSSIESGSIEFFKFINSLANRKFVVLHNINFWQKKGKLFKLFTRPRSEKHEQMLLLLKDTYKLIVLSDEVKYGIKSNNLKTKTIVFNPAICEFENKKKFNSNLIRIVIPGQYEQKRKNFDLVFELITSIPKNRFEFIFLGSPIGQYGNDFIAKCQCLIRRGYRVKYFEDFVSEREFNDVILDSDLIFAPINRITTFQGIEEVYTETKITGAIPDMIRFQKPGILPCFARVPLDYSNAIYRYNTLTDLVDFLESEGLEDFIKRSKKTHARYVSKVNNNHFIEYLLKI